MRKISDTSDIKQGDILRDPVTNALFEVLKVDFGMALLEIKTKSSQICASGNDELLESTITKIVEHNAEGKTSLKMEYAELLTLKSKLEESGYLVDLADCEISW